MGTESNSESTTVSNTESNTVSNPEATGVQATELGNRGRLAERKFGAEPRARPAQATGAPVGASPVTDERVAGDQRGEANDGPAATPATTADPEQSSAAEGPSPKSRATSRSLR